MLLKWLIATISHFLTSHVPVTGGNILYLVLPVVGIGITALYVRYVVRDNISHGVVATARTCRCSTRTICFT